MLSKSIITHCRKHGIKIEDDGLDVTFIAPKGKVFSTESTTRHFEDYEDMTARELIGYLSVDTRRVWT